MDAQISPSTARPVTPESVSFPLRRPDPAAPTGQTGAASLPAESDKTPISREQLENATQKVQKFVEARSAELQFSIDEASGTQIVRVFDVSTKELIRQIPSQEMVDMAAALDQLQGLLLKQKA